MQCLLHFYQDHEWKNFRFLELDALLQLNNVDVNTAYDRNKYNCASPYLHITLPSEAVAVAICNRSVLIKHIYELWGGGVVTDSV
jgi:tRNA (guanine10-N2)-methyltransferase